MKRIMLFAVYSMFLFSLAGCGGSDIPYDLDGTTEVEIRAYDASATEPFATVIVDGSEDVYTIVEHFSSLSLKEQEYAEPSVLSYELYLRDSSGEQLAKLGLPYGPSPWINCSGTSYTVSDGTVDTNYLAQLVDIAISSGPAA